MLKALLLGFLSGTMARELDSSTWDEAVAGKTILVKFQAPW
jgi:hypothetical protein